jgi:acyl-coenzyme A synthetase/AMP-(fatty) acid ligase
MVAENLAGDRSRDVALASGDRSVSYAQLAGAILRGATDVERISAPGSRLLIASRNQLYVGVALLAALHSRAMPLVADPTSGDRLRALVTQWRVTAAVLEPGVELSAVERIDTGVVASWLDADAVLQFEPRAVVPDEPAFWTFTSGTTGEPKAIVHAHRGPLAAYDAFAVGVLQLGAEDVTIATSALPFVYALGNNFLFPLMAGGTAILPPDLLLPTVLHELVRHGATVLVGVPWSLGAIARLVRRRSHREAIRRLRLVLSAGEPLPTRIFGEWKNRFGKELIDNFGCSEMFNSFVSNLPKQARAGSLGVAVPGVELRVGGRPPTPGTAGPLSVKGESRAVAIGQAGELARPGGEWCETGDEVEVADDGALRFLGRSDDRFRVKGRFLHPLEVERALADVPGVTECLAVCEADASGLPEVVLKVVPSARAVAKDLVRTVLQTARARLERFAVPARVDLVASLPRTPRGKLKRA